MAEGQHRQRKFNGAEPEQALENLGADSSGENKNHGRGDMGAPSPEQNKNETTHTLLRKPTALNQTRGNENRSGSGNHTRKTRSKKVEGLSGKGVPSSAKPAAGRKLRSKTCSCRPMRN
jgi:hypothetical protein